MSRAKHREHGWIEVVAKTDGWYWLGTKVCGVLGENMDKDFYGVEIIN